MIAVIETGAKQYLVEEGQTIEVELLTADKSVEFKPLLVIDGDEVVIGKPVVEDGRVKCEVVEANKATDKVMAIRYKPKKRVKKLHGHRQHKTVLRVASIKAS